MPNRTHGTKWLIKNKKKDGHWKEVGVAVIDEEDGTGILYLHHLDGEFKMYSEKFYERRDSERTTGVGEHAGDKN